MRGPSRIVISRAMKMATILIPIFIWYLQPDFYVPMNLHAGFSGGQDCFRSLPTAPGRWLRFQG